MDYSLCYKLKRCSGLQLFYLLFPSFLTELFSGMKRTVGTVGKHWKFKTGTPAINPVSYTHLTLPTKA